jgi:hypothetical protein
MTQSTATETTESEKVRVANAKKNAYSAATTQLRQAHQDEFNNLMRAECADRGVEWSPRPTERDRAREQVAQLLATFPDLAEEFASQHEPPF